MYDIDQSRNEQVIKKERKLRLSNNGNEVDKNPRKRIRTCEGKSLKVKLSQTCKSLPIIFE